MLQYVEISVYLSGALLEQLPVALVFDGNQVRDGAGDGQLDLRPGGAADEGGEQRLERVVLVHLHQVQESAVAAALVAGRAEIALLEEHIHLLGSPTQTYTEYLHCASYLQS